jgi:hypothetical protein
MDSDKKWPTGNRHTFVIMDFIMQPLHIKEAEFTYMILLSFSYDNAINISLGRLLLRIGQLSL